MKSPLVLLTDFGLEGPYVGQMKGVLSGLAPGHPIQDLTHSVRPHDIREGAFLLEVSWRYFPAGSVFVAVVDPGVGTERAPIALFAEDRYFVGPDNGLLTGALPPGGEWRAIRLETEAYLLPSVSATFHGRDLFAPAGAALARGVPLEDLGPPMEALIELPDRFPSVSPERIEGRIVHADGFGNLVSDISRLCFEAWLGEGDPKALRFCLGNAVIQGLSRTYGEAEPGRLLTLFGSMGYLEVAAANGSAARLLSVSRGAGIIATKT